MKKDIVVLSLTGNTLDYIDKIDDELYDNVVLITRKENEISMDGEFYLAFGSYENEMTVYQPILSFLNTSNNTKLCKGIIGTGNRNLGPEFLITPKRVSSEFNIPLISGVEIGGTHKDVKGLNNFLKDELEKDGSK